MAWKSLDEVEMARKVVLTRVDLNVPVKDGKVTDATRIERIVPTIRDILGKGGMPVLLAHFGRPKGEVVPEMSLKVVQPALQEALSAPVTFAENCIGLPAKTAVAALSPGTVLLLENTRFHRGEEANDPVFAAYLAALGEVYCNDAFSAAHRAHASTEALAHLLPACVGRLMQAELEALEAALTTPKRPLVAVIGGAKVSTKLDLLSNLIEKTDTLVIGGGMANTFLHAQGHQIGTSLAEKDLADTARRIMDKAASRGCRILLPKDVVVARDFAEGAESEVVAAEECPEDAMILDAGPQAVEEIKAAFDAAETLVWNGPLGAFEIAPFDSATNAAAAHAAQLTGKGELVTVAGGGDTVSALNRAGATDGFSYVSSAGGAFLEWMEGKTLPGIAALDQSAPREIRSSMPR